MAIFVRPTKSKEDMVIKEVGLKNYPSDSASGPDGIPAILLKNCAEELAYPFKLIWRESFHLGIVPQFYKDTCITPLFKKR